MTANLQMYIGGRWRDGAEVMPVRNPYSGETVAGLQIASAGDVADAIAAAADAYQRTRLIPGYRRSRLLLELRRRVEDRQDEIVDAIVSEGGKPIAGARVEAGRALNVLDLSAEEAMRMGGEVLGLDHAPASIGKLGITMRFPVGPVAAITPFNFPINLAMHKIGPALACGAAVVWKPSLATPGAAAIFARAYAEASAVCDFPAEALNVATPRDDAAEALAADPRVKVLSFTGSARVGWALRAKAGSKKTTLELGGNAAAIVARDADLDHAVRRIVAGGFGYAGQTCISVQRVLIEDGVYEEAVGRLADAVRALPVGDPASPETVVGPMISEKEAARVEDWIQQASAEGAIVLTGGQRRGQVVQPAIVSNVPAHALLWRQEAFGPVVTVSRFANWDEALALANDTEYGLQAGIFTRDIDRILQAFRDLQVGAVIVNDVPTFRDDSMPYGGIKESGSGREGVKYAIDEMTEPRALVLSQSADGAR